MSKAEEPERGRGRRVQEGGGPPEEGESPESGGLLWATRGGRITRGRWPPLGHQRWEGDKRRERGGRRAGHVSHELGLCVSPGSAPLCAGASGAGPVCGCIPPRPRGDPGVPRMLSPVRPGCSRTDRWLSPGRKCCMRLSEACPGWPFVEGGRGLGHSPGSRAGSSRGVHDGGR